MLVYRRVKAKNWKSQFFLEATGGDFEEMRGAQIHRLEKKVRKDRCAVFKVSKLDLDVSKNSGTPKSSICS